MLKVINKGTKTILTTKPPSSVSFVHFEQVMPGGN